MLAVLLLIPFIINCALGLADVYPYGGTRHSIFLAPFGLAGISVLIAKALRRRVLPAGSVAFAIVAACSVFPARHLPYIARGDQSVAHMQQAVNFIERQIPPSDALLVDDQTGLLLAHYLCRQQPVSWDRSVPGFQTFNCANHRVIATTADIYMFDSDSFFSALPRAERAQGWRPGNPVWVVQAGWLWGDGLAQKLRTKPDGHGFRAVSFGRNVNIFRLTVATPAPSSVQRTEGKGNLPLRGGKT